MHICRRKKKRCLVDFLRGWLFLFVAVYSPARNLLPRALIWNLSGMEFISLFLSSPVRIGATAARLRKCGRTFHRQSASSAQIHPPETLLRLMDAVMAKLKLKKKGII